MEQETDVRLEMVLRELRTSQKLYALTLMRRLGIYEPYRIGFEQENKVCWYEQFGGFWVYQEPAVETKMREIEQKYNCVCYAITHNYTKDGEMWSFLLVDDEPELWDELLMPYVGGNITEAHKVFYAFAYVWNKSDDLCSELGDVMIQAAGGGIRRIG